MKKIALLLSVLLSSSNLLASTDPEAISKSLKTSTFAHEKEVFSLYVTSDVEKDNPSLAQLYQDARERKKHLDTLFQHVRTHKFNKTEIKALYDAARYQNNTLSSIGAKERPLDLQMMHVLQAEYMPERDLVDYFLQALERFAQAPPSQDQIQELYKQVVYTCRMNMNSLHEQLFLHLRIQYPDAFFQNSDGRQFQKMNLKDFHNEEDRFYVSIREQYPREGKTNTLDTTAITKIARYCMHPTVTLTNPGLIFELNSLFFYLNIERALLSACPDLVFNPDDYDFKQDVELQNKTFALSRIADYHRKGAFYLLMKTPNIEERKLTTYLKMKQNLIETITNNKAVEPIDFFLQKLFPTPPQTDINPSASKTKTPKKSSQTKPKKGTHKKKPHQNTQNKRSGADSAKGSVADHTPTNFLDLLLEEDAHEEDHSPATLEELQEIETLIASADTQQPTYASATISTSVQPRQPLIIKAYKSSLHVDDYAYKRCISTASNGSYLFSGQVFEMPGMHFDVNTLREIKKITHHDPERANLQNLASYQLRFHFQHEDGSHDLIDFVSPYQYLSGGRRLRSQYRQEHHIKMAFHDYFTPAQAQIYLTKKQDENREFLLNILSAQVNENVVQGPWHHNCADSEALMLIDIQKEMPTILQKMAPAMGEKITLLGAVLGASTYHDPCWRCRNLFQGWQWGLSDTITHWKNAYHLPITLSPDFSTIVFGFGEVAPQSVDFFPPRASKVQIALGTSDIEAKRHKLTIVSLKKENL